MGNETKTWLLVFIGIVLFFACISLAEADQWSGSDKRQHKVTSGIGTVALYPVMRHYDVEYPKTYAAATMFAIGVLKEFTDGSRLNRNPTKFSGKDVGANAIGIAIGVGVLYGGELIEEEYGVNPFYFEW